MIRVNQVNDLESVMCVGIDPAIEFVEMLAEIEEQGDMDARTLALIQILHELLSGVRDALERIDRCQIKAKLKQNQNTDVENFLGRDKGRARGLAA